MINRYYNPIADCSYYKIDDLQDSQLDWLLSKFMVMNKEMIKKQENNARTKRRRNGRESKKKTFDNGNIFAYDCETSSESDFAWSYEQTLSLLNDKGLITFVSRDINSMANMFTAIDRWYNKYELTKTYNMHSIIWVHNLSYDFQFLLNIMEISEVLSRKSHDVIYAVDAIRRIMFRDSYSLLGTSLAEACNNYDIKHKKLVGDMNHSLIRCPQTPLTKKEWAYCLNDTASLCEIIQLLMTSEGYGVKNGKYIGYSNFPNTKTGLVRDYMKNYCEQNNLGKKRTFIMQDLEMTKEEYELAKKAYQGGYTHAFALADEFNTTYTKNKMLENVASYDITSDYPYQMVTKKYPRRRFKKMMFPDEIDERLTEDPDSPDDAYLMIVQATNVRLRCCEDENESPLAILPYKQNRVHRYENACVDNGKVYKCDIMEVVMTEQDYVSFRWNYDMDTCCIKEAYHAKKDYLPEWVIKAVFEFYNKKTTLKGVVGKELLYQYFKQLLNSVYGCCVQDPCKIHYLYDSINGWHKEQPEDINDKKRIVHYTWGVWVTAYARRTLMEILQQLDPKTIVYCDTDSCKFIDTPANRAVFAQANLDISYNNKQVADELKIKYGNISYDDFTPKNKKGQIKELGLWDYEGTYKYFKTTGAKRYITYSDDHGLEVTCCGIAKKKLIQYLIGLVEKNLTNYDICIVKDHEGVEYYFLDKDSIEYIFDNFSDDLSIEAGYDSNGESKTGKMVHSYAVADKESPDYSNNISSKTVTDYRGNTYNISCDYYIIMQPAKFDFNANSDTILQTGLEALSV